MIQGFPSSVNPCQAKFDLGAKGRMLKDGIWCTVFPTLKMAVPEKDMDEIGKWLMNLYFSDILDYLQNFFRIFSKNSDTRKNLILELKDKICQYL